MEDGRVHLTLEDEGVGLGGDLRPIRGSASGIPLLGRLTTEVRLMSAPEREAGCEVRMWFGLAALARGTPREAAALSRGGGAELERRRTRRSLGLEQEELDRDVGVRVDLAHVGADATIQRRLDDVGELLAHRGLEARADVMDRRRPADLDQRALDDGEAALEDAEHGVVDEEGLRRTGPLP